MATEFLMPKLGLTMEEGTILQWLVDDDTMIAPGTAVMIIETDKVESEVEAHTAGRLHRLGEVGETFRCGEVIAWLLADGEAAPAAVATHVVATPAFNAPASIAGRTFAPPTETGRRFISPNARRLAAEAGLDLDRIKGSGPGGRIVSEDLEQVTSPAAAPVVQIAGPLEDIGSVPATVAARQLADLLGVDLTQVPADPIDRYVTRESVARYVRERLRQPAGPAAGAAAKEASGPPTSASQPATSTRRLTGMRGTIAKRMFASLHEMAQLTLTMDAAMDAVANDRAARRASGAVPSYTDYAIAAVARALRAHPIVNSQVIADGIALLPDVHVGLAVALDDGLVVPVVRHADRMGIADLAAATSRLATAARNGQLTLAELEGATFSVSGLGAFGVDAFTPVINPPNVAILGVGRVRDDLVLTADGVRTTKRMTLSLTWDHRVFDGAPAALFCKAIVDLLGDPQQLE